jgi:integrase
MRPDPKAWGGRWVVDLRAAGFGQRYRLCDASAPRETALHLAYELLAKLRGERMAEPEQRDLFADAGPELFKSAIERWQADKRYDSDGGGKWGREYAGLICRELGAYKLADFAQPAGNARMTAYVRELERRELSGRTIRNRLSVVEQVLRFSLERGWLASVPMHPRLPPKAAPVYHWITEAMFRALRADVFRGGTELRGFKPSEPVPVFIARRRVYLSWLFYTGVHDVDAAKATADQLFLDGKSYIRHNSKSSRSVPDEQFEMPDPLHADLAELQTVLGRPFFPGESFTGGHWRNASKVMQASAVRLGFPHGANPSIFRRSYAREMFLRGYEVHEVADRMGHVDDRMLRQIYVRTPRPAGVVRTRWAMSAATATPPTPSGMARVLKLSRP